MHGHYKAIKRKWYIYYKESTRGDDVEVAIWVLVVLAILCAVIFIVKHVR